KALLDFALAAGDRVKIGIYNFSGNTIGSTNPSQAHPLADVYDAATGTLDAYYINRVGGMGTVLVAPLAGGLAEVGGYYNSQNSHVVGEHCQKNFVIVVTPGVSSQESIRAAQCFPTVFGDYDGDHTGGVITEGKILEDNSHNRYDDDGDTLVDEADEAKVYDIPVNINGNTYLDDVAHYLFTRDVVGYQAGFQNVMTYTIGFMGNHESNLYLINTANNGNGHPNLYNTADPEYGKYYLAAESPQGLATTLLEALNSILERTNAFAAPVVPVTRTTSGDRLYMSFFTPKQGTNFWEGNVVKFGLNANNEIVDKNGVLATEPNGAIKETAEPYWATINWAADSTSTSPEPNGILYANRKIYTYTGTSTDLTAAANSFVSTNPSLTYAVLGSPVDQTGTPRTVADVVSYIRGGDPFDADDDTIINENRDVITGDVLHSEPMVYEFLHTAGTLTLAGITGAFQDNEQLIGGSGGSATANGGLAGANLSYDALKVGFTNGETVTGATSGATGTISAMTDRTMIFFGANDGMLHAVKDEDGTEAWGFIPPNQLNRVKDIIDGASHQYFVDSSPRMYLKDLDGDGFITDVDNDGIWEATDDQVILICGERKGSTGYFALDVTDPLKPKMLWRINAEVGPVIAPAAVVAELGESWSEPQFGKVKTAAADAVGTPVMFIGGGYNSSNATGKAVLAINVLTGGVEKSLKNEVNGIGGMNYSIPSSVTLVDGDDNGFVDKVYVGDMGGQMWRFGKFTDAAGAALTFPAADE
ncbi:MAG: PilC/PilY family type IV pilus protein, partial [Desulfobulbaceae bacterium]|nr:PilC/PilY family type IV pilus protein [Desulfobulbaceae bacterium]